MRNLKKILSLALALVMTLSVMSFASAATSFGDADEINANYAEAVDVLSGLKVFVGDTNDDFNPKDNISRAEVAAVIYRIATQDVTNAQIEMYATSDYFDDVTPDKWFAGYVNYCANATYIKGTGARDFEPYGEVTGYQVLAMILRVAGYDANGEFTGADWQIKVASTAKELGIVDTVSDDVRLDQPVTREVVAELLFQTLEKVNKVRYTNAFGYVTEFGNGYNYDNLGDYLFGLEKSGIVKVDVWGRPGYEWTASKPAAVKGIIASYTLDPVYTTTVTVDECDIAKAADITAPADIDTAFIDGDSIDVTNANVTTDTNGKIDPLGTTSYVGAQGRVTEVYNLADAKLAGVSGYRIVEINTYLAEVEKVTEASTDKNGHPTDATIDLKVYDGNDTDNLTSNHDDQSSYDFDGVKATGYKVGDWVLVTISNVEKASTSVVNTSAKVQSVKSAVVAGSGRLTTWTNASGETAGTHTVNKVVYKDSDKFAKNYRDVETWTVLADEYGNVIGLVESAQNYLVVEAIEWKHDGTLRGGYALADVILADGTRLQNVKVSSIGDKTPSAVGTSGNTYTAGLFTDASVSDSYLNNGDYYGHLLTYAVNTDGSYSLLADCNNHVDKPNTAVDMTGATITKGQSTIDSSTNLVVANDYTVFLVANNPGIAGTTYTAYVGKDNVPTMTGATICYILNNGFASVVVVSAYASDNTNFVGYLNGNAKVGTVTIGGDTCDAYEVYKLGETTPTIVYAPASHPISFTSSGNQKEGTGLYTFSVDQNNKLTANVEMVVDDISATNYFNVSGTVNGTAYSKLTFDRAWATTAVVGNVFKTTDYSGMSISSNTAGGTSGGNANKDFVVTADTKIITVTVDVGTNKYENTSVVTAGGTIEAGDEVVVAYETTPIASTTPDKYTASVVYIVRRAANTNPSTTYTSKLDATPTWTEAVNGVTVVPTAKTYSGGVDAFAQALANAGTLSIKNIAAKSDGTYDITSGSTHAYGVIKVYKNMTEAKADTLLSAATATTTATLNSKLEAGYVVVIGDYAGASTQVTYARAYIVTD